MATSPLMVTVSGIRGIVGDSLTPEAVVTFARALGTYLEGKPVVIGRDSRSSGPMLEAAALAGLLSCGCTIHRLGIVPTPTVGVAVRELGTAGGIQITASHNPAPYNGLKLFGPRGMVLTATEGAEVVRLHAAGEFRPMSHQTIGLESQGAEFDHRPPGARPATGGHRQDSGEAFSNSDRLQRRGRRTAAARPSRSFESGSTC